MSLKWSQDRRLSEFSTFGIGGSIRYFSEIRNEEEMKEAFAFAREQRLPFFLLGKGSNCLFHDDGFDGIVLQNRMDAIRWDKNKVEAGSGVSFACLGIQTARKKLSGLEFAAGIPASVGGAIFMNAGADQQETKDVLESVLFLDCEGKRCHLKKEELKMGYRSSIFQNMRGAILSAIFQLQPSPRARQKQLQIIDHRMKTQPLKEKSAGCIFRNPSESLSAGALIDRCGLKGLTVGGAMISHLHANFIVNRGGATSEDVQTLIALVREKVHQCEGIHLEPEIRMIHGT